MTDKPVIRLFNDEDRYTNLGLDIDHELSGLIQPFFEKYIAQGVSIRDLGSIVHSTTVELVAMSVIQQSLKKHKESHKP